MACCCLGAAALLNPPVLHAQGPTADRPKPAASKPAATQTRPGWTELNAEQKAALAPLAASWSGLSSTHKRKWLALSKDFPSMQAADKAKLHSRMEAWAQLSPAERNQARLNFSETQELSPARKNAQWKAYQALSAEEKKALAAQARVKAPGTAPAISSDSRKKLAGVPVTRSDPHAGHGSDDGGRDLPSTSPAAAAGVPSPAPSAPRK